MLINRRQITKLLHENGMKGSKSFMDGLDQFIAMQVVGFMSEAKSKQRKILKREAIYFFAPHTE